MEEHDECCGCGCESNEPTMTMEDVAYNNNLMLNALIDILIEKKIITEHEFEVKLEDSYTACGDECECEGNFDDEEDDDDDDEDDSEEEESDGSHHKK